MSRPVKKKDGQAKGKSRSIERCSIATLTPDEAKTVLDDLLRMHPELQEKAEVLAANAILAPTYEDLADEVFQAITDIDLGDLNDRAGAHSWGYVEPTEAAQELLEESLKDVLDDMKRQVTLGFVARAEAICLGIVEGLYRHGKRIPMVHWAGLQIFRSNTLGTLCRS
ncbi:MAG: hypothetical protein JWM99_1688 [Verrucomicrobiales bacterium]|nr:hypothetical protein [Verrucomicrobiales bacterium]